MKKALLPGLCAAVALWYGAKQRKSMRRATPGDTAMRRFTATFIFPIWLGAGFLDYVWHRRTSIETTAGLEESLMHTLMMAQAGPAVLAGIFLEVNAGVLAMMLALSTVHEATAMWDVFFTAPKRPIGPAEQHTHTFLEMIPYCVTAAAICTHWAQFLALLGRGPEKPRFEFRAQHPAISMPHVLAIFAAIGGVGALPHLDELRRCWQARQRGLTGVDSPECARQLFG